MQRKNRIESNQYGIMQQTNRQNQANEWHQTCNGDNQNQIIAGENENL